MLLLVPMLWEAAAREEGDFERTEKTADEGLEREEEVDNRGWGSTFL